MNYTITIDDSLVAGLQDTLDMQNAQRKTQRKDLLPDVAAMLTEASVGLAYEGLNNIAKQAANQITAIMMDKTNDLTPEIAVSMVTAYPKASAEVQNQIKALLLV